jgi:hypothetical protein
VVFTAAASAQQPTPSGLRVDLAAGGRTRLEIGGQVRVRGELWRNANFGLAAAPAVADDEYALSRVLLGARLVLGDRLTLFVQGKSSLLTDRSLPGFRRTSDEDQLDVQQAWLEARGRAGRATAALRVGRTDLALGRERLVSPLDWTNARRTFQGGTLTLTVPAVTLTAVLVQPVLVRQARPNIGDSLRTLAGLYASRTVRPRIGADLYWLYGVTDVASVNGTAGKERRHTVGGRLFTRATPSGGPWDAEVEAAYQFGGLGAGDIAAWMVATQVGRTFRQLPMAPRFYVGLDYATGDDEPGGDVQTFSQLYPLAHAYLGYADVHGRQNVLDLSWGGSGRAGAFQLMVDVHNFWLASGDDFLYGVDGAAVTARDPLATDAMMVGTEVDLTVRRTFLQGRLTVQGGYSRYLTDEFLDTTGPSKGLHFAHVQVGWGF